MIYGAGNRARSRLSAGGLQPARAAPTDAPDPARQAAHRDTGLFFGCPDVDAAYRELSRKGAAVKEPVVTGYGMKQVYLRDPDGYTLCFQWPVEAEP